MKVPSGKRLRILQLLIAHGRMTGGDLLKTDARTFVKGMIYTTLHRLEDDGLVTSRIDNDSGLPGSAPRYYEITGLGQRMAALGEEAEMLAKKPRWRSAKVRMWLARSLILPIMWLAGMTAVAAEGGQTFVPSQPYDAEPFTPSVPYRAIDDNRTQPRIEPVSRGGDLYIYDPDADVIPRDTTRDGPGYYDDPLQDRSSSWGVGSAIGSVLALLFAGAVFAAWRVGLLQVPLLVWALFIGGERGLRQFGDLRGNFREQLKNAMQRGDRRALTEAQWEYRIGAVLLTLSCFADQLDKAFVWLFAKSRPRPKSD